MYEHPQCVGKLKTHYCININYNNLNWYQLFNTYIVAKLLAILIRSMPNKLLNSEYNQCMFSVLMKVVEPVLSATITNTIL